VAFALVAVGCSDSTGDGFEGGLVARDAAVADLSFVDVAADVGLDFVHGAFRWDVSGDAVAMMGGGICWIDFDRDGWLDLYVVNTYAEHEYAQWQDAGGLPTNHLYRNVGGEFVDVSETSGTDLVVRGNGCAVGDLDNDGWDDIYVTTARFNALLTNNGDGTFTENAEAAGVDAYGWQAGVAMGDMNGDGLLDLVMAGYVDLNNRHPDSVASFPSTHLGREDLLYINQGVDGDQAVFMEAAAEVGLEPDDAEYGLGVLLSDVDSDGDLDLYVANDVGTNRLYLSESASGGVGFTFEEMAASAGIDDANSAMGIAGGDYDGDGSFDLFVTNHGHQLHSVFRNVSQDGRTAFTDGFDVFGIPDLGTTLTGWGTSWADFDNDTDLDLFLVHGHVPVTDLATDGEPLQLVVNETAQGNPGVFTLAGAPAGVDRLGSLNGRGSAAADYDNDGDLDLVIVTLGGRLLLLENRGAPGNFITVDLGGMRPGAVVTAVLPDGTVLAREIHAGSSWLSSEDPRAHFGLGSAASALITVTWPDGSVTDLGTVDANHFVDGNPGGDR
jgi:hypothetical protein